MKRHAPATARNRQPILDVLRSRLPADGLVLEVAALGRDKGEPLDTYNLWKREHMTFPNGAHVVEVEIGRASCRERVYSNV